jgi:hypothetical protein
MRQHGYVITFFDQILLAVIGGCNERTYRFRQQANSNRPSARSSHGPSANARRSRTGTAGVNRMSRRVKQILLLMIAELVVAGCCSTQNELQHLSTSDLQLRRYELMYCLSMKHMSWDNRPWQTNAYNDINADLEEKEAIEREIARRGVTAYHLPPLETYRPVDDHCHCQCWVVTL